MLRFFQMPNAEQIRIDKYRKAQTVRKHEAVLDKVTGSKQDQKIFLEKLKTYFHHHYEDSYHFFVYEAFVTEFFEVCIQKKYNVSPFSCSCESEDKKKHQHFIIWIKGSRYKRPTQEFSDAMRKLLKSKGIVKKPEDPKITCKGIRIKDGIHLINCILYIQLLNTEKRLHSKHYDQNYQQVIIPDRASLKLFRKYKVDPYIQEYGIGRRRNPTDTLQTSASLPLQKLRDIASNY
jgi:hypothetical protein